MSNLMDILLKSKIMVRSSRDFKVYMEYNIV
jgi:hypothetical protein